MRDQGLIITHGALGRKGKIYRLPTEVDMTAGYLLAQLSSSHSPSSHPVQSSTSF